MKQCHGNYEAAFFYDCQICDEKECAYRKKKYFMPLWITIGFIISILCGLAVMSYIMNWLGVL